MGHQDYEMEVFGKHLQFDFRLYNRVFLSLAWPGFDLQHFIAQTVMDGCRHGCTSRSVLFAVPLSTDVHCCPICEVQEAPSEGFIMRQRAVWRETDRLHITAPCAAAAPDKPLTHVAWILAAMFLYPTSTKSQWHLWFNMGGIQCYTSVMVRR